MSEELLEVPPLSEPTSIIGSYRIAMVIDGVVHQILSVEAQDAARYLSGPTFVQVPRSLYVAPGDGWNGTEFSAAPIN